MGVLKFQLDPPDLASRLPELRKAYVAGPDRTPARGRVELREGVLAIHREASESGRVFAPWPVEGRGVPFVGTATLAERARPYDLGVELARGRLNDVRNQAADWKQMGLQAPTELDRLLGAAQHAFARAATSGDDPEAAAAASAASLKASFDAGDVLVEAYTQQVLRTRQVHAARLPTWLACVLDGRPKQEPWAGPLREAINAARLRCAWAQVQPDEGQPRWDLFESQLRWCRKHRLVPTVGPLIEFRPGALPDWLWLWEGDFDQILAQATLPR